MEGNFIIIGPVDLGQTVSRLGMDLLLVHIPRESQLVHF